jgi:hypothetical protein
MNTEYIENLLINSKNNFIPDVFDKIKNVNVKPIQKKVKIRNKENSLSKKISYRFAYVAMSIIMFFGLFYAVSFNQEYERVYLELNPSVEFVVNKYDKVLSVNYLNEDAESLYKEVEVKNKDLYSLIEVFVVNAKNAGYFVNEENDISLTIYSEKSDAENRLEKLKIKLNELIIKNNVNCSVSSSKLTKEEKQESENLEISPAKYLLIKNIMENSDYTFNELKIKAIKELKEIYKNLLSNSDNNSNGNGNGNSNDNDTISDEDANGNDSTIGGNDANNGNGNNKGENDLTSEDIANKGNENTGGDNEKGNSGG